MTSAWAVPLIVSGPAVPVKFCARATVAANSMTTAVMAPSSVFLRSKPPSPCESLSSRRPCAAEVYESPGKP